MIAANLDERGGLQERIRKIFGALNESATVTAITWKPFALRQPRQLYPFPVTRVPALATWSRDLSPLIGRLNTLASIVGGVAAALLTRKRWDVVYGAGLNPEGVSAAIAARVLKRPFVCDTWLPGPRGNVERFRQSLFFGSFRRLLRVGTFIAETGEVEDELIEAGFSREGIVRMSWGVDLQGYRVVQPSERAKARSELSIDARGIVSYWGRLDLQQKRLDLLVRAWREVAAPEWVLLIVGEGADRDQVMQLAAGAGERVRFLPWQDDIHTVAAASDIFALPTNYETAGRSMWEGLACGLPGLVSATRGYREMAPGGVVLVPNEPEAWTQALTELIEDDEQRRSLGRQGRAWVESKGDFRRSVDAFRELLHRL